MLRIGVLSAFNSWPPELLSSHDFPEGRRSVRRCPGSPLRSASQSPVSHSMIQAPVTKRVNPPSMMMVGAGNTAGHSACREHDARVLGRAHAPVAMLCQMPPSNLVLPGDTALTRMPLPTNWLNPGACWISGASKTPWPRMKRYT
jgi:hypothetical protein